MRDDPDAAAEPYRYDLCVLHADADGSWVEGYLLPALGTPRDRVVTTDDFVPGAPVLDEFERVVKSSRFCVVVLTPEFRDDRWANLGQGLAGYARVKGRTSLVPVVLRPFALSLQLESLVSLDFTDTARWDEEVARLRALLGREPPPEEVIPCPYPGMRPFRTEDQDLFFGREEEAKDLARRLRYQRRLVVIGPSGSGKSSLVFAGLVPELRRRRGDQVVVRSLRPGADPAAAVAQCLELGPEEGPAAAVARLLGGTASGGELLLVVDQLEEVFVQAPGPARQAFFAALAAIAATGSCRLLFTFRADFYADLMASPLWPLAAGEREEIVPLRGDGLRRAIVRPAAKVDVYLEPVLVEQLLTDAADEPGVLPLMQETLVLLWEERRRHLVTMEAYEHLGGEHRSGLSVALAMTADGALSALPPEGRPLARRIFTRLVQLNDDGRDTRRQENVANLRAAGEGSLFDDTLRHLTEARLLTVGGGEGDEASVDLAHDALIAAWPALRAWIAEDRQWLHVRRQISEATRDWIDLGRDPGALYRGGRLAGALQAVEARPGELTGPEQEFLDASAAEAARALEEQQARAALEVRAARQELEARLRGQADEVGQVLATRPRRALVLAVRTVAESLEAGGGAPLGAVQRSLHQAVTGARERQALAGHQGAVLDVAVSPDGRLVASAGDDRTVRLWEVAGGDARPPLLGHDDVVTGVAFSPDGRTLASAGGDGTVRLWDLAGRQVAPPLRGHDDSVTAVAFAPDGRCLATGSDDGTVRLWDVAAKEPATVVAASRDCVSAVAFSPDGRAVAGAGGDGVVRVWDRSGRAVGPPLEGHGDFVAGIAFSPDGRLLASAGGDGTVRLWAVGDGSPARPFEGHEGFVNDVVFGPAGDLVASAGSDGTVRFWDLAGRPAHPPLVGHDGPVLAVAPAPDHTSIATAGMDGAVRVWDWRPPVAAPVRLRAPSPAAAPARPASPAGAEPAALLWDASGDQAGPAWVGHRDFVASVAVGPQAEWVASVGGDRQLRLWDLSGESVWTVADAHDGTILAVAASPDGRTLATAGRDRAVRLWNVDGTPLGDPVLGHDDDVVALAFGPDGRRLASASRDATVRLWDLYGTPLADPFRGHDDEVLAVAFSPDGGTVASGSGDRTARLWSLDGRPAGPPLAGHQDAVLSVAFRPDGTRLATGSADTTVRLWEAGGAPAGPPFAGHTGKVFCVRFSPDGDNLVSAAGDRSVQVWDLDGNAVARPFRGHAGEVRAAEWTPDGRLVVSGGGDGTVRLWWAGSWRVWLALACQRLDRLCASGPPDDELAGAPDACRRALAAAGLGPPGSA